MLAVLNPYKVIYYTWCEFSTGWSKTIHTYHLTAFPAKKNYAI